MIILKHGKKPEPKRWKFRCKLCGCEWIADETEAECWSTWDVDRMISHHHATSRCPTCNWLTTDLCEVEHDEHIIYEQVEMPMLRPVESFRATMKKTKKKEKKI